MTAPADPVAIPSLIIRYERQGRQMEQLRLALMQVSTINPAAVIDWENPVATMRELAAYVAALKLELADARASAPAASSTQPKENHG